MKKIKHISKIKVHFKLEERNYTFRMAQMFVNIDRYCIGPIDSNISFIGQDFGAYEPWMDSKIKSLRFIQKSIERFLFIYCNFLIKELDDDAIVHLYAVLLSWLANSGKIDFATILNKEIRFIKREKINA